MITCTFLVLALVLGYLVTAGLSMAATFGVTAALPELVARNYRITPKYKFLQDGIWLISTTVGGYLTALVLGKDHSPWIGGIALIVILIGVLWMNAITRIDDLRSATRTILRRFTACALPPDLRQNLNTKERHEASPFVPLDL
jgi:hypothetical protein